MKLCSLGKYLLLALFNEKIFYIEICCAIYA